MNTPPTTCTPTGGTLCVYRGQIRWASNSEDDRLIGLPGAAADSWWGSEEDRFLSARVREDMIEYGRFLSVRLWLAKVELSEDDIKREALLNIIGVGKAEYSVAYSEDTGYLWTDDDLMVGGHDLLQRFRDHIGWFCHLEIVYHKEVPSRD
jgi:hypothetical protein